MPDDPKPLSPEEVDALEHRFSDIASPNLLVLWRDEIASLFATVRDRERQRDRGVGDGHGRSEPLYERDRDYRPTEADRKARRRRFSA